MVVLFITFVLQIKQGICGLADWVLTLSIDLVSKQHGFGCLLQACHTCRPGWILKRCLEMHQLFEDYNNRLQICTMYRMLIEKIHLKQRYGLFYSLQTGSILSSLYSLNA